MNAAPAADGGDLLRTVPGVAIGRMGGHGLEVYIRGQQQNQIGAIDAGSVTYGGCPNRMDPPTSISAIGRAGRIVVERGYGSVTNGPGATGGAVILERDPPAFEPGKPWVASLNLGGATNSRTIDASGTLDLDLGSGFYLSGAAEKRKAEKRKAENYEDGSGNTIRSAYNQEFGGLTFGYARDGVDLAFDVERDLVRDALFAGAGMDSPRSET